MNLRLIFTCILIFSTLFASIPYAAAQDEQPLAGVRFVKNSGDGLVAYWKFDEGSGATASSFPNHQLKANLVTNAQYSTIVPTSMSVPDTNSLLLDGSTSVVQVADDANASKLTNLGTTLTIAAWIKRSRLDGGIDTIYTSGQTDPNFWHLAIMTDHSLAFRLGTSASTVYSTTTLLNDLNWHHVAATVSASNLTLYVDGAVGGNHSGVAVPAITPGDKFIGVRNNGVRFPGYIDELRIYQRNLSAAEIARLAAGRGCPTNGLSWAAAFTDLQCALDEALPGEDIWITTGLFAPGISQQVSFDIPDGVDVLGDFTGTENDPTQRPPYNTQSPGTLLWGDLFLDDGSFPYVPLGNNSYHILRIFPGVDTTLDRLAVWMGNANKITAPVENSGGGLQVFAGAGKVILKDVAFLFNNASQDGAGLMTLSPLTLNNVRFFENTAGGDGGGIFSTAALTMIGGEFQGNEAANGGGVFLQNAAASLSNTTLIDNHASSSGGGIGSQAGALSLTATSLISNTTATLGGGISTSGVVTDTNGIYRGNTANQGGGVFIGTISGGGKAAFTGSTFKNNQAAVEGGGIFSTEELTLSQTTVFSNTAGTGRGGGVLANKKATITGGIFENNTAFSEGGGLLLAAGSNTIHSTMFLNNKANGNNNSSGGGLSATGGATTLVNTTLMDNQARLKGGGAVLTSASISGSVFQGNQATDNNSTGGGLSLAAGTNQVVATIFRGNSGGFSAALEVNGRAGCIDTLSIVNTLFYDNTSLAANSPTDLRVFDMVSTLVNNTFARPGTANQSVLVSRCSLTARNNIWSDYTFSLFNLSGTGQAIVTEDYNLRNNAPLGGSISSGGSSLAGNPLFTNPGAGLFSLQTLSPAVNRGSNAALPAGVLTDLGGNSRIIDSSVDMGAYETTPVLYLPYVRK